MSAYSYIRVSRSTYVDAEGNSVNHTEETLAELAKTMDTLKQRAYVTVEEKKFVHSCLCAFIKYLFSIGVSFFQVI